MKTKTCLCALCLIGAILPAMVQGADLMDKDGGGAGDRPRIRTKVSPVAIEVEPGMIHLTFTSDQGEVDLQLQDLTGMTVASQMVDTSVQNETSVNLPAGMYFLTATTADKAILTQVCVVIP